MANWSRSLGTTKNTIHFGARVDARALKGFMLALEASLSRGYKEIWLDFRGVTSAHSDAMLPIICLVDDRRTRGITFRVALPTDETRNRLFVHTRWANLLDPNQPLTSTASVQHLAATRYAEHPEQQTAVKEAVDIVLRNIPGLRRDVLRAVEWSVNEITDNVLNHAQAPYGGLVQVAAYAQSHIVKIVVSDGGRGIPTAMRETYPQLADEAAITKAMERGVTSPRDAGQGNGLAGSVALARFSEGSFKILSGRSSFGYYQADDGGWKTHKGQAPRGMKFPGTTVVLELSTAAAFDFSEALGLDATTSPLVDMVDLHYGEGDDLVIRVRDESLGVGTRHAGAELRRKTANLLSADPSRRLVLDWEGVSLISSSFADEAIGKLFVELGFTQFTARVAHAGTEPVVASLIDKAVMQRVAQSAAVQSGGPA
jgi:anti-anti-sigma regulatory factor